MVMHKGELDDGMVNTPIGNVNTQAGNRQRRLATAGRLDHSCQLGLMFYHTRNGREECLLEVRI